MAQLSGPAEPVVQKPEDGWGAAAETLTLSASAAQAPARGPRASDGGVGGRATERVGTASLHPSEVKVMTLAGGRKPQPRQRPGGSHTTAGVWRRAAGAAEALCGREVAGVRGVGPGGGQPGLPPPGVRAALGDRGWGPVWHQISTVVLVEAQPKLLEGRDSDTRDR